MYIIQNDASSSAAPVISVPSYALRLSLAVFLPLWGILQPFKSLQHNRKVIPELVCSYALS